MTSLNAHIGDLHTTLPTPEKEGAPDQIPDLLLTPIFMDREKIVAPCHRLLLLCLWSVICARAPREGQEVLVKSLSQVKMT